MRLWIPPTERRSAAVAATSGSAIPTRLSDARTAAPTTGRASPPPTPAWRAEAESHRSNETDREQDVIQRYLRGDGCVRISMDTGVPLSTVIRILKNEVCNGKTPNM